MEKLKNMINPGSQKDDEVMYGSGRSDDPVHSGTGLSGPQSGQGSHFGSSRTAGDDSLSSSTNPSSTTSGLGSSSRNDPISTSTNPSGGSQYNTGSNTGRSAHGLNEPYASSMPGGFDDDAATTASVRSGIPGQATQTGSGMTGSNDPSFPNKSLPLEQGTSGSGLVGSGGHSYPDRSVGDSGLGKQATGTSHLGRDAALGAGAVGAGTAAHHYHDSAQRDDYAPESGRSFPLGGNADTTNGSGTYGGTEPNTSGLHSSTLANKADPRIDSDLDGSRTTGSSGYGSGTGAAPYSGNQGSLARDAAIGGGTGAASGYGPESWGHEHDKHGHQYEGDPCETGEVAVSGPHFVQGPHATDTANRLDPHVAGRVGGTQPTTGHHGHHGHHGHGHEKDDAALAGGATGAGLGAYEGSRDRHGIPVGSSADTGVGPSNTSTGAQPDGPAPNTAGPHKSDMLNKLDPRVDSDLSKQRDSTETGPASSTTGASDPYSSQTTGTDPYASQTSGRDHHHRGAEAAAGGAGLAGAAAYEDRKHHGNQPTSTTSGLGSSGPYNGSGDDPRMGSGRSNLGNTTGNDRGTGGREHHQGRDAALGAGAGGLAYEAERHHGKPTQSSKIPGNTTGSAYDDAGGPTGYDQAGSQLAGSSQQPLTRKDHHYGRDAGLGAGAGGLAYEAEKHHNEDRTGVGSTPQDQLAGSGHQAGRDHHLGRDAAVGGAALGAGTAGVDEHEKFRETGRMDPGTKVREHQHPGASLATYPSPGYGNERDLQQNTGHQGHRKEEEALAGGAGAGGLAHHEHSKKEERAFEKEEKHHEKQHEKERAKHMAAIEKDQKKHEHDGEKKHGGLLGFLHRDKHDKNVDQPQSSGLAADDRRGVSESLSSGAGTDPYDRPLEGQHGTQLGAHDSSLGGTGPSAIGSGATTHDAYGTSEGHNKLHKDPPAKVLEARGQDYQGHSNVK